jgi:hypothetical protein
VRRPAAPLPLPVGQHHLKRPVGGDRLVGPVDERKRLPGREGRGRRDENGVAGLRHGGRTTGATGLGEDQRPLRVPGRLAQVQAAHAGRTPGRDQRSDDTDGLIPADHQMRHAVAHELGEHNRVGPAGEHRQVGQSAAVVGRSHVRCHPADGPGDSRGLACAHVGGTETGRRGVRRTRDPRHQAADPGHPGRGEQRGDARAHATRAVNAHERRAAVRQYGRAAVTVAIGKRGAGQLGDEP